MNVLYETDSAAARYTGWMKLTSKPDNTPLCFTTYVLYDCAIKHICYCFNSKVLMNEFTA